MTGFRVLVTGSRDWSNWKAVEDAILQNLPDGIRPDDVTIVHGGARGADTFAGMAARRNGFAVEAHPADWDRYGRAAGHRRNAEMVAAGADVCLAFPIAASPGTRGCMALVEKAGIPLVVHTPRPRPTRPAVTS